MYKNYQYELFSTSWGVHEGFKTAVDRLNDLIPIDGKCEYSQSKNKNLEKFRKAQNAMYDLFNNGLCNKKNEFRKIFGFTYSKTCLLYTSPSPRDGNVSRMPSSA